MKNLGPANAELSELHFAVESVIAARGLAESGSLAKSSRCAAVPTKHGHRQRSSSTLAPRNRRAFAQAIPKSVNYIVVTAPAGNWRSRLRSMTLRDWFGSAERAKGQDRRPTARSGEFNTRLRAQPRTVDDCVRFRGVGGAK